MTIVHFLISSAKESFRRECRRMASYGRNRNGSLPMMRTEKQPLFGKNRWATLDWTPSDPPSEVSKRAGTDEALGAYARRLARASQP
jgi:hypothetical protein